MPEWSSTFRDQLETGTYHPQFRLRIGTHGVSPASATGRWERGIDGEPNVVEITSHGDSSGGRDVSTANYTHVRGLTRDMSFGGQSIAVRTWELQTPSMSIGVTPEAASKVLMCSPGTMSLMQMSLDSGATYHTIFVGMYYNMSWSSSSSTVRLEFRDALSLLNGRATDDESLDDRGATQEFHWFKGVGHKEFTVSTPSTPGSSTQMALGGETGPGLLHDITISAFRNNGKRDDAFKIEGTDTAGLSVSGGNRFAYVKPDGGDPYYLRYTTTGTLGSSPTAGALNGIHQTLSVNNFGSNVSVLTPTGSKVKSVLAVYGNPVAEVANTMYGNGYSKHMMGSIFGTVNEAKASPYTDYDRMSEMGRAFIDIWRTTAPSFGSLSCPFKHIVSAQQRDGFSYFRSLFAKVGVFPRFKCGAYSVGYCGDPEMTSDYGDVFYKGTIPRREIVSVDWSLCDTSARQIYSRMLASQTDLSSWAGADPLMTAAYGNQVKSAPIQYQIEVKTTDVAPGAGLASTFIEHFRRTQFEPWYARVPSRCTIVVGGFKWAHLAPGDVVDVEIGLQANDYSGSQNHMFGPSSDGMQMSVLDTVRTGTYLPGESRIWVVTGTNVNWLRGIVTLELHMSGQHVKVGRDDYYFD
tara:strand:+ start:1735 stop:3639 length:1905 start_codon:yes stop_codon:yes gene_type:complete